MDKITRGRNGQERKDSIVERAAKQLSDEPSAKAAGGITVPDARKDLLVEAESLADLLPESATVEVPPIPFTDNLAVTPSAPPVEQEQSDRLEPDEEPAGSICNIDIPRLRVRGYITPGAPRNRLTEEYRLIKRAVLNHHWNGTSKHGNLILITSSLPNEGKTYTAINLVMSMAAEENLSVVLVDADLNKPGAMGVVGCKEKVGLIDVLENPEIDFADVLLKTNIPNLSIVPSGQLHDRSTELLAGGSMRRLAEELSSRYENRIIVFDGPPLLATTEAAALTAHMGQVLFMIQAEATKESTVRHALELIDPKPEVGLVLNRSHSRIGGAEFGDYYHSSYGKYGYGS